VSTIEPGVTARKPSGGRQKKIRRKRARDPPPSERGTHAYSVPQAGTTVGLSRGSSYAAAARGKIPTERFGDRLIVPKAAWHRKLGIQD
jgi:hypothetical protein